MIGHFGNNALEFMKRKSKPKKKNIELLNRFIKNKNKNLKNGNINGTKN
ncbi:MAG: hypothetical protein GOVbin2014_45 [Prokaryotic dsDNA virus sp.]|jgi:hypothetical protein|nr:MAG: hypothetical protein GOVbin2014_45 [Prokaryotic dsDNA virus sp.]|tara:strand:+ start:642 stop:788 length:147 start_codon:yes stop_codon:yes gene_type:complete